MRCFFFSASFISARISLLPAPFHITIKQEDAIRRNCPIMFPSPQQQSVQTGLTACGSEYPRASSFYESCKANFYIPILCPYEHGVYILLFIASVPTSYTILLTFSPLISIDISSTVIVLHPFSSFPFNLLVIPAYCRHCIPLYLEIIAPIFVRRLLPTSH